MFFIFAQINYVFILTMLNSKINLVVISRVISTAVLEYSDSSAKRLRAA